MKLSIIIPAYNESKNLRNGVLDQVNSYLLNQVYSYEVIIVDDGSKDETVKILKDLIKGYKNFKLIENPHGGKAITVMTGLIASMGEKALFTDMDQATPINQIEKIMPKFNDGYDIVIGQRAGRKGAPLVRKLYALGFVILRNLMLGLPVKDTQCGFKAFTREVINEIFPSLLIKWKNISAKNAAVNAGFDSEMLFIARKRNFKIAEVPVEWHYVGSERVGLMSALEAIKDMVRIRINDLFGKYD